MGSGDCTIIPSLSLKKDMVRSSTRTDMVKLNGITAGLCNSVALESAVSQRRTESFNGNEEKEMEKSCCMRKFTVRPNFFVIFFSDVFTVLADQQKPVQ